MSGEMKKASVDRLTYEEVRAHFIEVIGAISELGLTPNAVSDYADAYANCSWRIRRKQIPRASTVFELDEKMDTIIQALPELKLKKIDVFKLLAEGTLFSFTAEVLVKKISAVVDLVFELKDPLVPREDRNRIEAKSDAFQYILHSYARRLMAYGDESIADFRQYAELVKQGDIRHEGFLLSGGRVTSIFQIPVAEVKRRLGANNKHRAKTGKDTVITPKPKRPGPTLDRKANAAGFAAFRAKAATLQK